MIRMFYFRGPVPCSPCYVIKSRTASHNYINIIIIRHIINIALLNVTVVLR